MGKSLRYSGLAVAVLLAMSAQAVAKDYIGVNKEVADQISFYSGVSEIRDSTLTMLDPYDELLYARNSTLNLTGGNTLKAEHIALYITGNASVNITGKNHIEGGNHGIQAHGGVTVIDGENTIVGAKNNGHAVYSSGSSTHVYLKGTNILNAGSDGIFAGNNSTVYLEGTTTINSTGGDGIRFFVDSNVILSGTTTISAKDWGFSKYGSGHLTFKEGSTTKVTKASAGIDIQEGDVIVENGADVSIENDGSMGIRLASSKSKLYVRGALEVTSTGAALKTDVYGVSAENLLIDGGTLKLTTTGDVSAITSGLRDGSSIVLSNGGELQVEGKVDEYDGNFTLSGQSKASFTDLTLVGTLKATDSTLEANTLINTGEMSLAGAQVSLHGSEQTASRLGTVRADNTTFSFGKGSFEIDALAGDNNTLVLPELVNTQAVEIEQKDGRLDIRVTGGSNDQYASASDAADAVLDKVLVREDMSEAGTKLNIEAGAISNALTADIVTDAAGNRMITNVTETKNDKLDAFGSVVALTALTLRHEMNSLSKRMGELRDAPAGVGVWVRAYGSEMEYGDQSITAKNTSLQVGSDYSVGDWKIGAALIFTDGESTYDKGSADNKGYGVALYGTWFVPCGAYVDLMAKYNRLENDFGLNGMNGSYENNAFGVSAETGYRWTLLDGGVYLEPQVGLSYGKVKGDRFKAVNGVLIDQDDFNSFIGRVGVRTGFKFPEDKGTVYARVAGVYDFDGEISANARRAQSVNSVEADIGGAWVEFGVGANFNWTKNTYSYVDLERSNGGDVKENWRWNIGVRHTF